MMGFLQAGKALYVLAAVCPAGVLTRLMAESSYRRLIKESVNMAPTESKYLRGLKQDTEGTYCVNQGVNNTRIYLERQMYGLRTFDMSIKGLDNLPGQLTLFCFLVGDGTVFLSYWLRSDNRCIMLYGTTGILVGMFTMLMSYGVNSESRGQQLLICLQDYLEDAVWPRMNQGGTVEHVPAATAEENRRESVNLRFIGRDHHSDNSNKRGLKWTAANREKQEGRSKDNWFQDLSPEQKRMLGELLKEFIS